MDDYGKEAIITELLNAVNDVKQLRESVASLRAEVEGLKEKFKFISYIVSGTTVGVLTVIILQLMHIH